MISERLKKGGIFYIVDFHPIVWMFDYTSNPPKLAYGYHQKEYIYEEYEGTYADEKSKMISKECTWNHSLGEIITSLPPLPKIREVCPKCEGRRFKDSVLEVLFKGHSIADVLALEVNQALVLFAAIPKLYRSLKVLQDIGLGYISLGQNSHKSIFL